MRSTVKSLLASLMLVAAVAGCGKSSSSASSTQSLAAIKASGTRLAADLEAGRYASACEGFSAATRAELGRFPQGGCAGALGLAQTAGGRKSQVVLGQLFRRALNTRLPHLKIKGDEALYNGAVEARYEQGRWRFEIHGSLGPKSA
jgi:hypothetical protein